MTIDKLVIVSSSAGLVMAAALAVAPLAAGGSSAPAPGPAGPAAPVTNFVSTPPVAEAGSVALPPGVPDAMFPQDQLTGGAEPLLPFGADPLVPYGSWAP